MTKRDVTISWEELTKQLRSFGTILPEEGLDNITLVKPKQLQLHLSRERLSLPPSGENKLEMPTRVRKPRTSRASEAVKTSTRAKSTKAAATLEAKES